MTTKHANGPWISVRDKEVNEILIKTKKGRKFIASLDLHSIKTGTEENCANARLIAASPSMYDFIKSKAEKGDEDAKALLADINL